MSTLDSFKAIVSSSGFQAQGSVDGKVAASLIFGSASGSIAGTFKVNGGDSDVSIVFKILGATATYENIVVGDQSYSLANGGGWSEETASGKTLQGFVASGVVLTDQGIDTKFGRQLHHLTVADLTGVDPSAFGISAGPGQTNLTITGLSFWAEDDGTPAGLSIAASFDQEIFGTASHETLTLDVAIDSFSRVTITPPMN